ncbi:MAG TPA: oxidoreductase [Lentisphaeria bacterium]|nr:MAG: hypothetical protein A2X48_18425 [Lentisphaerae bacterium GWF2_49_21]HBC87120.1 oxidoreductase [Lentisphaeria bacterium]
MKNTALIGAGYWGKNIARSLHELGALKTVCDSSDAVKANLGKLYPDVSFTGDLKSVLSDGEIKSVFIASPAVMHYQQASEALKAGKNVFVEKPLSLIVEDAEELIKLAESLKKILFVGHILHYHPAVIKMKKIIADGTIGKLQYIYSNRLNLGKIRTEENILWSFAPHDISLILSLTDENPSYVNCAGSYFLSPGVADITMTNLKFPSGIGAHIFVSWLNPFKEQRLIVTGSKGMLVFEDTKPTDEKLISYSHTIEWKNSIPIPQKAEPSFIKISDIWEEPLKAECSAFLKAVETGKEPLTSGKEGLKVLKVLKDCQTSIEKQDRSSPCKGSLV